MANESEVIQHQMEETRTALQDKLETLEQQVKNTVQDATEAVSDTVASVKDVVQDTVETVKDSVHDTVETVKDSLHDTVESVKDTFDMASHVRAHPWPMLLGATAIGFFAERWFMRGPSAAIASAPAAAPVMAYNHGTGGNGFTAAPLIESAPAAPKQHWWNSVAEQYGDEIAKFKGLALGTIGGIIREMVTSSVAPALAEQIKEIVDGTTVKMGGHLVEGPILPPSEPSTSPSQSSAQESRYALNMGRSTAAAR